MLAHWASAVHGLQVASMQTCCGSQPSRSVSVHATHRPRSASHAGAAGSSAAQTPLSRASQPTHAPHAWGLEHEFKCEDPMTYLYGCGEKSFQDGDYPCGEYEARACECGGASQNAYQYILDLFGPAVPDTEAPTATITSPDDGDVFAVGDDFDIAVQVADDNAIAMVELYLDGELSSADMADPYGPWPVIDAIAGSYEIYVVATDAAGKETVSGVVRFEVTDAGAPPDAGDTDGGDEGGGTLGDGDAEGDGDGGFDGSGEPSTCSDARDTVGTPLPASSTRRPNIVERCAK